MVEAKQRAQDNTARAKRLKALYNRFLFIQSQTITQFMKWGPEVLHIPKPLKESTEQAPETPIAPQE